MKTLCDYVFWAGRAKIEGRRHADPKVKSAPVCSRCAWIHACRLQRCTAAGGRCAPLKSADTDPSTARAQVHRIFKFGMSENEDSDTRNCLPGVKLASCEDSPDGLREGPERPRGGPSGKSTTPKVNQEWLQVVPMPSVTITEACLTPLPSSDGLWHPFCRCEDRSVTLT